MPTWLIGAGLRFFAVSVIVAFALVVLAPLGAIRLLALIALTCAVSGLALHLYALRVFDPPAFAAIRAGARYPGPP